MWSKIRLSVAVLVLVFTAAGCGGGSTSTYTISGTVSSSGAGLQGVVVTLHSAGTTTFTTDASGKFTFPDVTKGIYSITPSRTGYTFSPSTLTAEVDGANVADQNFIVTANTTLNCTAKNGSGAYGIQFYNYGGLVAINSTATANATEISTLTWQVQYQNVAGLPADAYSGSLRARLWAVPYSISSGVFTGAYVIGEFYPRFAGAGAASSNQLYVGSTSDIQVTRSTAQNPPAGEYCIVATLEEYYGDSPYCSSPDHYCENDWWQSANAWIFY